MDPVEQGRLDGAEASLRRALMLNPDFASAHTHLGAILRAQGCLDEAEASFRRARELDPDYAVAHNNKGSAPSTAATAFTPPGTTPPGATSPTPSSRSVPWRASPPHSSPPPPRSRTLWSQRSEDAHGRTVHRYGETVGRLRHDQPELVELLNLGEAIARSPRLAALLFEGVGHAAAEATGKLLARGSLSA